MTALPPRTRLLLSMIAVNTPHDHMALLLGVDEDELNAEIQEHVFDRLGVSNNTDAVVVAMRRHGFDPRAEVGVAS